MIQAMKVRAVLGLLALSGVLVGCGSEPYESPAAEIVPRTDFRTTDSSKVQKASDESAVPEPEAGPKPESKEKPPKPRVVIPSDPLDEYYEDVEEAQMQRHDEIFQRACDEGKKWACAMVEQ